MDAIAEAYRTERRDEIKRIVAILKIKLPYFFRFDETSDGSCHILSPECDYADGIWMMGEGEHVYIGGLFQGFHSMDPIRSMFYTENCPMYAQRIIEETQHEVAPGSEVRKYTNGMSTN